MADVVVAELFPELVELHTSREAQADAHWPPPRPVVVQRSSASAAAAEAAAGAAAAAADASPLVGKLVRIEGTSREDLNGQEGRAALFDPENVR